VFIINNSGPCSKPCGKPDGSVTVFDEFAPSLTNCSRPTRYDDSVLQALGLEHLEHNRDVSSGCPGKSAMATGKICRWQLHSFLTGQVHQV
jgi:hypothetical protein